MTLVLGATLGNGVALVGDALVTDEGASSKITHTPATADANASLGKVNAHVAALCQKINILSKNVIFGWSGPREQARRVALEITEMARESNGSKYVPEAVHSMLSDQAEGLSVLGLIRDERTTRFFWDGLTGRFRSSIFDEVVATGSGANDMFSLLDRYEKRFVGSIEDDDNDLLKIAVHTLGIGTQVYGLERLTQLNLSMKWGGGIEVALFNRGVATKIDNVMHTIWMCDMQENGTWTLSLDPTFIRTGYYNDILVSRTFSTTEAPRFIIIPPLLSDYVIGDTIEIPVPPMSYDWLCNCIFVRKGGKVVDVFSYVHQKRHGLPISIEECASLLGPGFPFKLRHTCQAKVRISKSYFDLLAEIAAHRLDVAQVSPLIPTGVLQQV